MPLAQTQHMRPGGIQDANSSNEHHSPVDTDLEDPAIGKKPRLMPAMPRPPRLTRQNADKLKRVLAKVNIVLPSLTEARTLFTAKDSPYISAAFLMSLVDSIQTLEKDAHDINLLLQHKEDDGTSMDLHTRVQDHLHTADQKVRFVATLRRRTEGSMLYLNEIMNLKEDADVQFIINLRGVTPQVCHV